MKYRVVEVKNKAGEVWYELSELRKVNTTILDTNNPIEIEWVTIFSCPDKERVLRRRDELEGQVIIERNVIDE